MLPVLKVPRYLAQGKVCSIHDGNLEVQSRAAARGTRLESPTLS